VPVDDVDQEAPSDDVDIMVKASISNHLFNSQQMPKAAAFIENQTMRGSFMIPNTLNKVVVEGIAAARVPRKKARKRPNKKAKASSSQPTPIKHVLERVHMPN
jgi:hypothetical protein